MRIEGPHYGRSGSCEPILRALGPWFGIEAATRRYIQQTDARPTWLAQDEDGEVVGFLTVATHYPHSWEILVMGVRPDWHRRGAGRALVNAVAGFADARGVAFLQVKTLAAGGPAADESYAKTRTFYEALGFLEVEVFEGLWDASNPALMLAKPLRSGRYKAPIVRNARPADAEAIAAIHRAAFESDAEARLVAALTADERAPISLAAMGDDRLQGHILFSELRLECDGKAVPGLALAPLAVTPAHQRHGVGGMLVRAGLFAAREQGHCRVIVLGDPEYYGRFGFSAARAGDLESPYSGPAFQAIALQPGAFDGLAGATVRYPAAFNDV